MQQQRISGVVELKVIVAPDGTPKEIVTLEATNELFDRAAADIIKEKWKWPPLPSDKPQTDRHFIVPFKFEIRSPEPAPTP